MPIAMRHNEALELTRVDFFGKILPDHVRAYGAFGLANPTWVGFDTISFVSADADVSSITSADLDAFFNAFGGMLRASDKMVRRRTGWVCENAACQHALSQWLAKRNASVEADAHVRQFSTAEAVSEWLLLSADGGAALKSGDGFADVALFDTNEARGR